MMIDEDSCKIKRTAYGMSLKEAINYCMEETKKTGNEHSFIYEEDDTPVFHIYEGNCTSVHTAETREVEEEEWNDESFSPDYAEDQILSYFHTHPSTTDPYHCKASESDFAYADRNVMDEMKIGCPLANTVVTYNLWSGDPLKQIYKWRKRGK